MKIMIDPKTERQIIAAFDPASPIEQCLVLVGYRVDETVVIDYFLPVPNHHEDPENNFRIMASDVAVPPRPANLPDEVLWHEVVGVAHSHPPGHSDGPSSADIGGLGLEDAGIVFSASTGLLTYYTALGPYPMHLNNIPPLPKVAQDILVFYVDGQKYEANLSWLLSNWTCLFGNGCIGCSTAWDAEPITDVGCCHDGAPVFSEEDAARVDKAASELTVDDLPQRSLDYIEKHGWMKTLSKTGEFYARTRVRDNGCVFLNREKDGTGRIGCAFHYLGKRTGRHHTELVPQTCWQLPLAVRHSFDDIEQVEVVRLVPWDKKFIGHDDESPEDLDGFAWWCVNTPDAYVGENSVLVGMERELRLLLGDRVYETLREQAMKRVGQVAPMPGAIRNEGRPMLPLFVEGMARLRN